MANKTTFNLPFKEASSFFQAKLNIPTDQWDDLWQQEHAKGFMVAGAVKADLLTDFRGAVQKAIDGGMTLKEFQSQFDTIVAKHGWGYNGGRGWRSALIYDTNVTTAYQDGRWQQFVDGKAPALKYLHADGVRNPRPQHLAWDGIALPIGHPFWKTHYPPNGWGCKCRAVRADEGEITAAPQGYDSLDLKTGAPEGIDKGWAYNVGEAGSEEGYGVLTNKLETLPYQIAGAWAESMLNSPPFQQFFEQKVKANFPVAVLSPADKTALGATTQTVWFSPQSLAEHLKAHPEIGLEDYRKIQKILDEGEVYKQQEGRLVFLQLGDKLYRAAVKTTQEKTENFFLTLFETTDTLALEQVKKKFERIR